MEQQTGHLITSKDAQTVTSSVVVKELVLFDSGTRYSRVHEDIVLNPETNS